MTATYQEFQQKPVSEKVGLAVVEATQRITANPGIIPLGHHRYPMLGEYNQGKVVGVTEAGVELDESADYASMTQGSFFWDRENAGLYIWCTDDTSPATKFIVMRFQMFFATEPLNLPHNHGTWDGYDVHWEGLLTKDSEFVFEIENTRSLLGVAVSSASGVKLTNLKSYWQDIYDQVTFASNLIYIYSWSPSLPITEAALLYRGRISKSTYGEKNISFEVRDFLDELRSPVALEDMSEYVGASIPDSLSTAKQRRIYGYATGHLPTPIDQWNQTTGWPLTGTLTLADGATAFSGSGTAFLSELSPGDEILIGDMLKRVRIDTITSNTAGTIAEAYDGDSQLTQPGYVLPSHPKRYMNRRFLVAGHELSRPSVQITSIVDNASLFVDSTDELLVGDTLEFNGEQQVIRVIGVGFVKMVTAFVSTLAVGNTLYLASVSNVYLDGKLLTLTDDYTYDPVTALITLESDAEFNIANSRILTVGTSIATAAASRAVVGVGTLFRTELKTGDWIKTPTGPWAEILEVVDDLNLTLRTAYGDTSTQAVCLFRSPNVYKQGTSHLSCNALGKKDSDGNFIRYPGAIAKDILIEAGLEDDLDTASFDTIDELCEYRLSISIPKNYKDKKSPTVRETLNAICRSVFAVINLNKDYELEMNTLEPSYEDADPVYTEFTENEILSFNVQSDSTQIVRAANIDYNRQEFDPNSGGESVERKTVASDTYLYQTEKEFDQDTLLIDEDDAEIAASRWAFLLSRANSDVKIRVKMQASRMEVFDTVKIDHEQFYTRLGSTEKSRIGAIVSIKKKIDGTEILVNDLGNAFTRCARITEDDAADFDDAEAEELLLNGYMTDLYGVTDESVEINLIW